MAKNKVFLGLYGSGKTEIAMNFAIKSKVNGCGLPSPMSM